MDNTESLAAALVYDAKEQPLLLGTLWLQRPVVLVFVHQLGGVLCRAQIADFCRFEPQLRELGADLVVVGPGEPAAARPLREEFSGMRIYTSPGGQAFVAAGCRRGIWPALGGRAWAAIWRAWQRGFRPRAKQGDVLQLGGVWALGPGCQVHFAHASQDAGDIPAPGVVLRTLYRREAAVQRAASA